MNIIQIDNLTHRFADGTVGLENINLSSKIMKAVKPIMHVRLNEMIEIIGRIIERGIAKKEFKKVDPCLAAVHYLNTIRTGFFVNSMMDENKTDKDELLKLFFNGLGKRS